MKSHKMNSPNNQRACNRRSEARGKKKIFVPLLVLILGAALLLSGCERPATDSAAIDKRLSDLEKEVGTLQEQNRDLRMKLKTSHGFGRSPLQDFFASAEFWECTYDSSWHDCSSRCAKQTSEGYNGCINNHPEGPERVACVEENSANGANCLKACPVQTSPSDLPNC